MPKVFLSYSHSDAQIVDRIAEGLRREGTSVWQYKEVLGIGTENWLLQIEKAIRQADFVLVFISRASLQSQWVQFEYRAAFEHQQRVGGTRLIPVLLEKAKLPAFLVDIQFVDFTESYSQGMQTLLRALQSPSGPKPIEAIPISDLAKQVASEIAKLLGLENGATSKKLPDKVDPKLVFVIMAFRDDMEPIYEGIEAATNTVGLVAKRVKDVPGDYRITDQIIQMIHSARFIVADLTHERPNVYFELGYARGLGKTIITIARGGTTIHFDVKDWAYIPYIDSRVLERKLEKRFEYELARTNSAL